MGANRITFFVAITAILVTNALADENRRQFRTKREMEEFAFAPTPKAPPREQSSFQNAPTGSVADFIENLGHRFSGLGMLKNDPTAYAKEMGSIQQQIAAKKAEFFREAQAIAYARYGVASYEKEVQKTKQIARSNPYYVSQYGDADSDETIAARENLLRAKIAADRSVPGILQANSDFQGLQAYADTLTQLSNQFYARRQGQLRGQ